MRLIALISLASVGVAVADTPPSAPLSLTEAPQRMTLPPGFRATLFAGEPDVVQPIATAFDDRGRLWVAESLSYPDWVSDPKLGRDRIIIFEDQNGDGKFSKKTVFATNVQNVSGIELGYGGVWVCASPNLLFIPIDETGDKSAGPPQVMLDGWDIKKAQHNVFNRCVFGPDGWLYGCNGIQSKSLVGKPGTPDSERTPIDCGVWRFHPTRHVFEVVATGTTNPWGLDWDDYGEMFITNCVIEHVFHVVPGARFKRMYGEDFDKHSYGLMQSCADHIHWAGGLWQDSRSGSAHADAGGGHAHAGCMVYLGDNWPAEYRNNVFMCNIHGNRVNRDLLEHKGSGYVARHGKDFLLANDSWFRGLNLVYGPDGGVFVQDWCDTGECHDFKVEETERGNGRIYKIVYGPQPKPVKIDIAKLNNVELVKLQTHRNDWYVRLARLELAERTAKGSLSSETRLALRELFKESHETTRRLRALWALNAVGDQSAIVAATCHEDARVKAWALRLMVDDPKALKVAAAHLLDAARSDSPVVRLAVASAARRIPPPERKEIIRALASRAEDAADQNHALMIWYAAAPYIAQANLAEVQQLLPSMKIPLLRELTTRLAAGRSVNDGVALLKSLVEWMGPGEERRPLLLDALRGAEAAWKDKSFDAPPPGWADLMNMLRPGDAGPVLHRLVILSIGFRDPDMMFAGVVRSNDGYNTPERRRECFSAVMRVRPTVIQNRHLNTIDWRENVKHRLNDPIIGDLAIRALGLNNDPNAPQVLLKRYAHFPAAYKREALSVLASRVAWAQALLTAVKEGKFPKHDVDSVTVRSLVNLKDKAIAAEVEKLWGRVRQTAVAKKELMAKYRGELAPGALKQANLSNGRAVYAKVCGQCHTLFDSGGKLGPELTGSQRANLDYLLENVLDPSAVVAQEYRMTIVQTADGRTLTGVVTEETPDGLTLKTPTENLGLRKAEIEKRTATTNSIMPEGAFEQLTPTERRDLVAYLASPKQVSAPPGK